MKTLKVENFYRANVTSSTAIPATGDFTITLSTPPVNNIGFLILGSEDEAYKQIFFYYEKSGSTITVKGANRITSAAISNPSGLSVKMTDVAEIFNFYADNISTCFNVEKNGGLSITVYGGYVIYNNNQVEVPDTALTLTNNATNYIKYNPVTNTVSATTAAGGNIKAVITCASGVITEIVTRVSKEVYHDASIELIGALPSLAGNAGFSLHTDGTTVFWAANTIASISSSGTVEVATQAEFDAGTDIGSTGSPLVVPPSMFQGLNPIFHTLPAGETIAKNDLLKEESQYSYGLISSSSGLTDNSLGNVSGNTRIGLKIIGNGISASTLKLSVRKVASPSDNIQIRIETDSGGVPSGALAHANATASIAGTGLTTSYADTTFTFGGAFSLTDGALYHIIVQRSAGNDAINYYQVQGLSATPRGFQFSLYNGTSYGSYGGANIIYFSYAGSYSSVFVKATAANTSGTNWVGFSKGINTIGQQCTVLIGGIVKGFTGLTGGYQYYLSDTAGLISTTSGTNIVPVCIAKGSTTVLIDSPKKSHDFTKTSFSGNSGGATSSNAIENKGKIYYITLSGTGGGVGTQTVNIQTSNDGSSWSTFFSITSPLSGNTTEIFSGILPGRFIRLNQPGVSSGSAYSGSIF